jgi:DNA-binding NtrC family response regulator
VLAEIIHGLSPRAAEPFVAHQLRDAVADAVRGRAVRARRGAFTDAREAKPGMLETAEGGTVMLDEIGELPLPLQAKLLRGIETREGDARRRGSSRARSTSAFWRRPTASWKTRSRGRVPAGPLLQA